MHDPVHFSAKKLLFSLVTVLSLAVFTSVAQAQFDPNDPPPQAGRISIVNGGVSIQPAGTDDWGQAYPNLPIGPGDRIYTYGDGRAEIQIGQNYLRIGPNTDVTLTEAIPERMKFAMGRGSVHVRSFGFWSGQQLYVETPNGSTNISQPGEFRVDVFPDDDATVYSAYAGGIGVSSYPDIGIPVQAGQAVELFGSNPVASQWLAVAPADALDSWSMQRDGAIMNAASYQYLSREVPGGWEMDAAGQWTPGSPYGPIWFPNVQAGWAPYRYGHWVSRAPWGWVWVADEPWGYAPFHYGRWVQWGGRWGWIPGPPAAHPVWSPALVVFAGGISVGGGGVSAWFPLGPGEPFRPWYPCSPRYIDQVNITNITPAPRVVVQRTYVNIVNVNVTNITYVNRTVGVTAVPHEAMASGRAVGQARVQVDPQVMARATVLAKPEVEPPARPSAGPPPRQPVPVKVAAGRPVVMNEKGQMHAAALHATPAPPPAKPAPQVKLPAGHAVAAPPPGVKTPTAPVAAKPNVTPQRPGGPAQSPAAAENAKPVAKPVPPPPVKPAAPPAKLEEPKPTTATEAHPVTAPEAKPVPSEPAGKPQPNAKDKGKQKPQQKPEEKKPEEKPQR